MPPGAPQEKKPVGEIENWNLDRTVDPFVMVRGQMVKRGGSWLNWDGSVSSTNAATFRVSAIGALPGGFETNHIAILSAAATEIVAPDTSRTAGVLIMNHGTQAVYIGSSAVTTSNGVLLTSSVGAGIVIPTTSAVYGRVGGTENEVSFISL